MNDKLPFLNGLPEPQAVAVNLDLVKVVQNYLDLVRQGRIVAGVFIGIGPDGSTSETSVVSTPPAAYMAIGALESVKANILVNVRQAQTTQPPSPIIRPTRPVA